jgi:transposase
MKTNKLNIEYYDEELIKYEELAAELKVSVKTLQNWKSAGRFHPSEYIKYGETNQAPIRFKKHKILERIRRNSF